MAASRAQTLREIVLRNLQNGADVWSDRSSNTSDAIQGEARGLGIETVREINRVAVGGIFPHHVLWIDTSPEKCYQRALSAARDSEDKFEAESFEFFEATRRGYEKLYAEDRGNGENRFHRIDGNRPIETIHQELAGLVFGLIRA